MEGELVAFIQEAPADIDIIPGGVEGGVESSNLEQNVATEREVAAREMFGSGIGKEDVRGVAQAGGDDGVLARDRGGRKIRSSCRSRFGIAGKGFPNRRNPLGLGPSVVVDVDDECTFAFARCVIASHGEAGGFLRE